jgi:hypothetical protein
MAALRTWKVEVEVHQHRDVPLLLLVLAHETDDSGGVSDTDPPIINKVANQNQLLVIRMLDQKDALDESLEDIVKWLWLATKNFLIGDRPQRLELVAFGPLDNEVVEINWGVPIPHLLICDVITALLAPPLNHLKNLLAIGEECAVHGTIKCMHEAVIDVE